MTRRAIREESTPCFRGELNIVPFIDVFSMLNTFLLMTAVFTAIGIIEVQIPFLTSAPPPKEELTRSLDVKVDMEKDASGNNYTDFHTLIKLDNKWTIIGKTFHTYAS